MRGIISRENAESLVRLERSRTKFPGGKTTFSDGRVERGQPSVYRSVVLSCGTHPRVPFASVHAMRVHQPNRRAQLRSLIVNVGRFHMEVGRR